MKNIVILISIFLLNACTPKHMERIRTADNIAAHNSLQKKYIQAGDFTLTSYQKINNPIGDYYIYIEGDGIVTRGQAISDDPTPINPLTLKLATLDPRSNVIYIARPGQYTEKEEVSSDYWNLARYSGEVIDSLNQAINQIADKKKIHLIGYSGGGALAVLIAAKNQNVKSITTIAGNLDIDTFCKHHNTPLLARSENPIHVARKVAHIPQLHLSGSNDKRVPSFITENYKIASGGGASIEVRIVDATHFENWEKVWSSIVRENY